jgi:hypothetical protein
MNPKINKIRDERFFYHCFPRRHRSSESVSHGIEVLSSMLKSGLLLTPEVIRWGNGGKTLYHLQRRICFTELSPSELPDHADDFGPFALEFSIDALRELSGMPVFYVQDP